MNLEPRFAEATHIVFTPSGAATLRQRIAELNAVPKVLCLQDNLSLGPLACSSEARTAWFESMFGIGWSPVIQQRFEFWNDVKRIAGDCCVWLCRNVASDCCGYLEWVSHRGSRPHKVVDADMPIGLINLLPAWLEYFADATSADRSQQSMEARNWSQLSENAPVRRIENSEVVSAPLSCFDNLLLAKATPDWRSAALMVGEVLAIDFAEVHQTGDLLLFNRLWALVDAGRLEALGDHGSVRSVQMRIRPT
jgi:hypothetical protein